jgi:PEP-CTERM motif
MTAIGKFFSGIVVWLGLTLVTAQAAVVNVDFNGAEGGIYPVLNYTGQGALITSDAHYWNPFTAPLAGNITINSLLASDGTTPTTVSVSLTNVLGYPYNPLGPNASGNTLMDDVYFNAGYGSGTPSTFLIGGLATNKTYNLYLYGNAAYNLNVNEYFQIGSTTNFVTGRTSGANATGSPSFWASGTDYALFTSIVPNSSGQISGSWSAQAGNGAVFSGLQIEEVVPEPSTILLLGVGGLLVWRRIRRVEKTVSSV